MNSIFRFGHYYASILSLPIPLKCWGTCGHSKYVDFLPTILFRSFACFYYYYFESCINFLCLMWPKYVRLRQSLVNYFRKQKSKAQIKLVAVKGKPNKLRIILTELRIIDTSGEKSQKEFVICYKYSIILFWVVVTSMHTYVRIRLM